MAQAEEWDVLFFESADHDLREHYGCCACGDTHVIVVLLLVLVFTIVVVVVVAFVGDLFRT